MQDWRNIDPENPAYCRDILTELSKRARAVGRIGAPPDFGGAYAMPLARFVNHCLGWFSSVAGRSTLQYRHIMVDELPDHGEFNRNLIDWRPWFFQANDLGGHFHRANAAAVLRRIAALINGLRFVDAGPLIWGSRPAKDVPPSFQSAAEARDWYFTPHEYDGNTIHPGAGVGGGYMEWDYGDGYYYAGTPSNPAGAMGDRFPQLPYDIHIFNILPVPVKILALCNTRFVWPNNDSSFGFNFDIGCNRFTGAAAEEIGSLPACPEAHAFRSGMHSFPGGFNALPSAIPRFQWAATQPGNIQSKKRAVSIPAYPWSSTFYEVEIPLMNTTDIVFDLGENFQTFDLGEE